jgi:hypothetical protein
MNKYYLLFLVFINFNVSGQNNTQLWTRINIISNINKNWSFSNEFNIRMQSQNNTNLFFDKPLVNAYRIWINYKIDKNNYLHISPFAFFKNYKLNDSEPSQTKVANEYRWQIQWENHTKTNQNVFLNSRFGIEHRIFEEKENSIRLRIREGLLIDLNHSISFFIHDEFMINLNKINTDNIWDQNRITFQTNIKTSKLSRLEIGTFVNTTYDLSNNKVFFANLHLMIN